jgi:hypothetical protein
MGHQTLNPRNCHHEHPPLEGNPEARVLHDIFFLGAILVDRHGLTINGCCDSHVSTFSLSTWADH